MPNATSKARITRIATLSVVAVLASSSCVKSKTGQAGPVITAGGGHTCRATAGGAVDCWGANDAGQVGNARTGRAVTFMSQVAGLTGVTAIAAGLQNHTCAVAGGTVRCWGGNGSGQLGNGSTAGSATPVSTNLTGATDVTAGARHSCAIAGGQVHCWGDNANGQFGNGNTTSSTSPVSVGLSGATRVAAGFAHTCAILGSGSVSCWGNGPLGNGTSTQSTTPVAVSGITDADVIAGGLTNTCVLLQGGTVRCWGANSHGELGNGTTNDSPTPVPVSNVSGATAIAIGGSHGCAVVANGEVRCWGDNMLGQLGQGSVTGPGTCGIGSGLSCSTTAVAVPGVTGAVDVAAGDSHTCAVLADDRVTCWGWNGYGQLANGQHGNGASFARSPRMTFATPVAIAVGGGTLGSHSCAIVPDGRVKCWGANSGGAVGDGSTGLVVSSPVFAQGVAGATSISAGGHSCAVVGNGTAWCWGLNAFRQIGPTAAQPNQTTPLQVSGLTSVAVMLASRLSTCAIRAPIGGTPELRCWGVNNNGQLGFSNAGLPTCAAIIAQPCTGTPTLVPLNDVLAVGGGAEHTCALVANGTVRCWGQNVFGQLGRPGGNAFSPAQVNGVTDAIAIAVASFHVCALRGNGSITCWGRNRSGQLGNGTEVQSVTAVPVTGITTAVAIAASSDHSCALLDDGTVRCWGDNGVGQLGLGTTSGPQTCTETGDPCSPTPVAVPGLTGVTHIATSVGASHVCAVLATRAVHCWGSNVAGQLGRGTQGGSAGPGPVIGL